MLWVDFCFIAAQRSIFNSRCGYYLFGYSWRKSKWLSCSMWIALVGCAKSEKNHTSQPPPKYYIFCIFASQPRSLCLSVYWFEPHLSACSWVPVLWVATVTSSHKEGQHSAWNYSRWSRSKTLLVHNSFHSKNVVETIWLNRVASWLGQWVAEDLLVFSYLSQLREKANIQRTGDSALTNTYMWPQIPASQMSVPT